MRIRHISILLLGLITGLCYPGTLTLSRAENTPPPVELGRVRWRRDFNAALTLAVHENKPVFVLFQEVPGCFTCQKYGYDVLSHPFIVEAIESYFIPVAIFNNRSGLDAQTLREFREPGWNNPVVRIISPVSKDDLVPRLNGDYSQYALLERITQALGKIKTPVPPYLDLFQAELKARDHAQEAVLSMPCFWTGEQALGTINGVISTKPGYLLGQEVVEVRFDPQIISYQKLIAYAKEKNIAGGIFTRTDKQHSQAAPLFGTAARSTLQAVRPDKEQKYYLSKTPLKYIPMSPSQASRVNAAIASHADSLQFLSPRQILLLKIIENSPDAKWDNMIGEDDFPSSWETIMRKVGSLQRP